jgi:hypothetical protein
VVGELGRAGQGKRLFDWLDIENRVINRHPNVFFLTFLDELIVTYPDSSNIKRLLTLSAKAAFFIRLSSY